MPGRAAKPVCDCRCDGSVVTCASILARIQTLLGGSPGGSIHQDTRPSTICKMRTTKAQGTTIKKEELFFDSCRRANTLPKEVQT